MRPEFAPFQLELRAVAVKQLGKLSDLDAERIQGALERMAELGIGDIKDVGDDYPGKFRLRVGKLRIYFDFDDGIIDVKALEKRGEAYKRRSRNK